MRGEMRGEIHSGDGLLESHLQLLHHFEADVHGVAEECGQLRTLCHYRGQLGSQLLRLLRRRQVAREDLTRARRVNGAFAWSSMCQVKREWWAGGGGWRYKRRVDSAAADVPAPFPPPGRSCILRRRGRGSVPRRQRSRLRSCLSWCPRCPSACPAAPAIETPPPD